MDQPTCPSAACARKHSAAGAPRKAEFKALLTAIGTAIDGGWVPPAPKKGKRSSKKAKKGK
jgi:hypothetical protein